MDNRDNELFNGIIDISTIPQTDNVYNPGINTTPSINHLTNSEMEIIDVSSPVSNTTNVLDSAVQTNTPEIIDFDFEVESKPANTQGKEINHELLQNLNKDTNNLVNPNMIINPLGKKEEPSITENVEEPKVDYNEIKTKKGYMFMAVIFLIILLFIIFLPKIMSFIGI